VGVGKLGSSYKAKCKQCGHKFTVSDGGGFFFHLLHCDKCGSERSVGFDELGDIHLRYVKGLPGPYCTATNESDKNIKENYPGEPLDEHEYNKLVEQFAGKCKKKNCNGRYRLDAPARCPKCRSLDYEDTHEEMIMYD
jgi:hypothetical protein